MSGEAQEMDRDSAPEAAGKAGGKIRLLTISDIDGRTKARKQADAALSSLVEDLGGEQHLSTSRRLLAQHAAVLHAMAEDQAARFLQGEAVDVSGYSTLTNSLRRLLETIGLDRVPRNVTPALREYMDRKAASAEASA